MGRDPGRIGSSPVCLLTESDLPQFRIWRNLTIGDKLSASFVNFAAKYESDLWQTSSKFQIRRPIADVNRDGV